ncbi:arabinofuranosidase catalytic domain-containing protein [Burkholderia plantarii]|uniref:arabinofuranosidase catalytic domain-containing protein n=1 Tax=Burkholderia plantarii TaxID=41899 RepID=UPI000A64DD45|nr:arabinofuranosidase catalytic domain-containing protein [Burkholderia plantarii]
MWKQNELTMALAAMTMTLAACNGDSGSAGSQSLRETTPQNTEATTGGAATGSAAATAAALPCDALAAAGTACSAAHSVTRLLTKHYTGPLFRVLNLTTNARTNIFPYTAGSGVAANLVGTTNLDAIKQACGSDASGCVVDDIYDQIDLVAPLQSAGQFGNVAATLNVVNNQAKTLTIDATGQTVPVTGGFAQLSLPNGNTVTVQVHRPSVNFPALVNNPTPTNQAITIGNDLPFAGDKSPSRIRFVPVPGGRTTVALDIVAHQSYRNRIGTVNQSIGDTEIAEYMVAGTNLPAGSTSACCGTYGNMEDNSSGTFQGSGTVPPSGASIPGDPVMVDANGAKGQIEGMMFGLAYASGNAAVFGYGPGYKNGGPTYSANDTGVNWPGVDAEAGVYLYGPKQPLTEGFVTVLAKYSPQTQANHFAVKGGDASQAVLTSVYSGVPPEAVDFFGDTGHRFLGRWEGGLSLGEGGDESDAPIEFYEGAIITKMSSDAADNAVQGSIQTFYGPPTDTTAAACQAGNLATQPLALANTSAWHPGAQGSVISLTTDISGTTNYAAVIGNASGSPFSEIDQWVKIQSGQTYVFTDYLPASTGQTIFPAFSVQTDDGNQTEFAGVLNTNNGVIVPGTWGAGGSTLSTSKVGNWWKVSMKFTAPAGASNAHLFLDPRTSNASGARSTQSTSLNLSATHYCPGLSIAGS